MFIVIFKFNLPILNEPSVSYWYTHQTLGRSLRYVLIRYEYTLNAQAKHHWHRFLILTVPFLFKHRHWTTYTPVFQFCFKTRFTFRNTSRFYYWMGIGTHFIFSLFRYWSCADELASTYCSCDHYCLVILFNGGSGGGGAWGRFSQSSGKTKITSFNSIFHYCYSYYTGHNTSYQWNYV